MTERLEICPCGRGLTVCEHCGELTCEWCAYCPKTVVRHLPRPTLDDADPAPKAIGYRCTHVAEGCEIYTRVVQHFVGGHNAGAPSEDNELCVVCSALVVQVLKRAEGT